MRRAFLVLATAAATLPTRPAEACGGGGVTTVTSSSQAAVADSQRIVLAFHDDAPGDARTEIIAQIGVPAVGSDYGVLIPVPGRPELDPLPISSADLDALDRSTAPTIVTTNVRPPDEDGGSGCGCGSMAGGDTEGAPSSVSVGAPVNVGPVTAVVLESADGSALTAWLGENGFAIPSERQAIVDHYVAMGDSFIAIRRNDTAPPNGPTSIGLHYTLRGDHRQLSLRFARIGAAPTVAFTVFVTAPTSIEPAGNFTPVALSALSELTLKGKGYSAAVAEAVTVHGWHAFVMEGSPDVPSNAGLSPTFRALLGIDAPGKNRLTRLSTVIAAEALDTDVRLDREAKAYPSSVFVRVASAELPGARESSLGVLSLVFVAQALRRRLRRRDA